MLELDQLSRLEEAMSGYDMTSPEAFFSVFYVLFSVCLIAPPTEFVAAGLTVQNLLANFLGSEKLNFVYYNIKRTAATVVFHSLLPLGKLDIDWIECKCANTIFLLFFFKLFELPFERPRGC